jgi:uncharacterized protein
VEIVDTLCDRKATVKIQLETAAGNIIRSYAFGRITVNQETFTTSLIITPERIVADWRPEHFSDLIASDFDTICDLRPEVVLLGTGKHLLFPAPELIRPLVAAQIGFEVMDTGAACRTYNVLMGEGRRVAAALLMDQP